MAGRNARTKIAAADKANSPAAIQAGGQRIPVQAASNPPPSAKSANEKYLREGL